MIKVKEIVATLIPIIIGGLIALVIKTFLVTAISVDGSSMAPNLYANETVVLLRHAQVKRNQIVVFSDQSGTTRPRLTTKEPGCSESPDLERHPLRGR